jgi:hypothetical protein
MLGCCDVIIATKNASIGASLSIIKAEFEASRPTQLFKNRAVSIVVMATMPFLSRVLHVRSRILLPGFLKPPLIAGGIHDARRTAPRQGRRDI